MSKNSNVEKTRNFKQLKQLFDQIDAQIPGGCSPPIYNFFKQLLINDYQANYRLRNLEVMMDGKSKLGVGTFKKIPLPNFDEPVDDGE